MPSSASSCDSSSHGTMASKLKHLALGSKPYVNIVLENEREVYSTSDRLSGKIEIAVSTSTRFEDVEVQFIGFTKTYLEKLASSPGIPSGMSAYHQFLKLKQPIAESCYPQPRVLETGRTYEFPFLFIVPQQLLPRICRHEVQHQSVHDCHVQLPPSMGTNTRADDLSPDMAKIQYQIAVRVTEATEFSTLPKTIATKTKNVCIVPRVDEQPPINVQGPDSDYILRAEKNIKKGVFKGRLGSLVAEAEQPKTLRIPSSHDVDATISTMAHIKLRFDPSEVNSPPPRLSSMSSKLKVCTWHASGARPNLPKKKDVMFDYRQGLHSISLNLSSRCMGSVEWSFHESGVLDSEKRDSVTSTLVPDFPSPSTKYKGHGFYTAEIVVPVTLPKGKHFVPTFHSCLVSRTYTLNLSLGIHSAGVGFPSIDLKIPVQVSAEGISEEEARERSSLTLQEQQEEQRSVDEFFVPSTSNNWAANDFMSTSVQSDLPPGYETLTSRPVQVAF